METEGQNAPLSCRDDIQDDSISVKKPLETDESQSNLPEPQPSVSNGGDSEMEKELVELKVIWNKNKYDVKFPLDSTGADLKQKIHSLTGETSMFDRGNSVTRAPCLHLEEMLG